MGSGVAPFPPFKIWTFGAAAEGGRDHVLLGDGDFGGFPSNQSEVWLGIEKKFKIGETDVLYKMGKNIHV